MWSSLKEQKFRGRKLKRGFDKFILEPIKKLIKASIEGDNQTINKIMKFIGKEYVYEDNDDEITPKAKIKKLLRSWFVASDCLNNLIVSHLPSP